MLHWPLNAPHRVVNADTLNVSFTTEHFTDSIRRCYHVNFGNGVLRQRLRLGDLGQRITGATYWGKLAVGTAYKISGLHKRRRKSLFVEFVVDPTVQGCVKPIPGYVWKT